MNADDMGMKIKPFDRMIAMSLTLLACTAAIAVDSEFRTSRDGLYRLSFESELDPIEINRMHRWTLHLETATGDPVDDAALVVTGGMPAHDHGLPTSPRVSGSPEGR